MIVVGPSSCGTPPVPSGVAGWLEHAPNMSSQYTHRFSQDFYSVGNSITYMCGDNKYHNGKSQCQSNGKWSIPLLPIDCKTSHEGT